jgi:tRNA uridine 5-carbamoylmethylation protein Kti12
MISKNIENRTIIIYLTGKPGFGKYTIAKALAKHNFIICDNQLANNSILSLLNHDGLVPIPEFAWNAVQQIRNILLNFISQELCNNYILTNNLYENEVDKKLFEQVKEIAIKRNSLFIPVRLLASEEEHLKRILTPERRKKWKSISTHYVYDPAPLLKITHPNLLELDVTLLPPTVAAKHIMAHVNKLL